MAQTLSEEEALAARRRSANAAAELVHSGMALGLGTGRNAALFVERVGARLAAGELREIVAVATSEATEHQARALGIVVLPAYDCPILDLAVDGADEVDADLNLVKGRGGALLREKIVASNARRFVVVVDDDKLVDRLGTKLPLPIEVARFAYKTHLRWLEELGWKAVLRQQSLHPVTTDNGNFIIDASRPEGIVDPAYWANSLAERPGIVEHGLFLGMASVAYVGGVDGLKTMTPSQS